MKCIPHYESQGCHPDLKFKLPCLDAEQGAGFACITLATLSKAAATSRFIVSGLSQTVLRVLFDVNAGRFLSRRRLIITASVLTFQYARSINGTIKVTMTTVKFLYQIT